MLISEGLSGMLLLSRGLSGIVPLPDYENCEPRDSACVARNAVKNTNYNLAVERAQADNNYSQCLANAANATSPQQYKDTLDRCDGQFIIQTPDLPNTAPTNQSVAGTFQFQVSRPGNVFYPGDTWSINITSPNAWKVVSTSGSGPGGMTFNDSYQGTIDGAGRFSTRGTFGASDGGNWLENWKVDGKVIGVANFSVVVPSSNNTTPANTNTGTQNTTPAKIVNPPPPPSQTSGTGSGTTNTTNGGAVVTTDVTPEDSGVSLLDSLSQTEMIGLAAGALVVGYFIFKGGR